jgi:hypothetical protein
MGRESQQQANRLEKEPSMKNKLLLVFALLSLVFSFPLAAQVPDDNPEVSATVQDADKDGDLDADVDIDTEADTYDDPVADDDKALVNEDDAATIDDDTAAIDADGDELPRTASPLPLIALLGAGSLISALGFRVTRK